VKTEKKGFFREYWADFNAKLSNQAGGKDRWRVNDRIASLDLELGERWEPQANGLVMITLDEKLKHLDAAELYLEMWGGHPHTSEKSCTFNGKGSYTLPQVGTDEGHCTYSYPEVPLTLHHLVSGTNALQFVCARGESFWGHFIIDRAAIRCFYKTAHPALESIDAGSFNPRITAASSEDAITLSLEVPEALKSMIERVAYFGHYRDFDDRGDGQEEGWHGYTHGREWTNHIGTASRPPFEVTWETEMIPDQENPVLLRAEIQFRNGLKYLTGPQEAPTLDSRQYAVQLIKCTSFPKPFWSRDGEKKEAVMHIDADRDQIEKAMLYVKIWDGGEGTVQHPFLINGHPYPITSGQSIHDVVFTKIPVKSEHLKRGENVLTVLSDTEHHGIEMLLPGPCLKLKVS
jgi:hypothetical protein